MNVRSLRGRLPESANIWPGFVDILATLLIVIIFILMIFTVSQIYLSDAISGRDKALEELKNQINELSKILIIETQQKEDALSELESTQLTLKSELLEKEKLEKDISQKESEIISLDQQMIDLGSQIQLLTNELQIIAKALETYEGDIITNLETANLGERINKALANKIQELNLLNKKLEDLNLALNNKDEELNNRVAELEELNITLNNKDEELNNRIAELEELNIALINKDEELVNTINEYQLLTEELINLNEKLDIKDQSLVQQLETIKLKNNELAQLNTELIQKDKTITDLRGKIIKLNEVLSVSEEESETQKKQIISLSEKIEILQSEKTTSDEEMKLRITASESSAKRALEEIRFLSDEIDRLNKEIATLNLALEANETEIIAKELKIEVLGDRLNKALTNKVFELQKYRSEFFGRLQSILGQRDDIKIVGDRFIFESELLFDTGSANLQTQGETQLSQIAKTLKQTTDQIPSDINWIIQVEGHTDKRPINTIQFPSNWELSSARANTVLKLLLNNGFSPNRLSAAGYGEFYPISFGESEEDYRQNRRIELKLTAR